MLQCVSSLGMDRLRQVFANKSTVAWQRLWHVPGHIASHVNWGYEDDSPYAVGHMFLNCVEGYHMIVMLFLPVILKDTH